MKLAVSGMFIQAAAIAEEDLGGGITRKILGYNNQLMMVKLAFKKNAVGALHHHLHSQVTYVESGSFEVEINGEKQTLQQGDGFYIPPDAVHGVLCVEEGILIDAFSPSREDFLK